MPQKSMRKLYSIKSISHHYIWLPTKQFSFCLFCYGSIWRAIELLFDRHNQFGYWTFQDLARTTLLISNSECVHHFLHQHQYQLFLPQATDSDDNHISAKQCHQLQSFESSFSISALLVDSGEIPFSICSKILLQYVVHVTISFLSMHLVC